jgi:fused signal recognition particle receptor
MTTILIVALVLLVGVIFVVLLRRAALPGGPGQAQKSLAPPAPGSLPAGQPAAKPPRAPSLAPASERPAVSQPTPSAAEPSLETGVVSAAAPAQPAAVSKEVLGLRKGLAATRGGFMARLAALLKGGGSLDASVVERLEEVMLSGDVGPKTTQAILARLKESVGRNPPADAEAAWNALRAEATRILSVGGGPLRFGTKPTVVLVVGVNGVGKTTTIGKLATRYGAADKRVMLAAGDTFRAAAVQQLEVWGKRVGAEVVRGKEGADPGAVAFDATTRAKETGADLLLVDTAGRLHTKVPLMDEIKKVRKTIAKALDGAPHETLLVLDATTGQNALQQAVLFRDALELTGVVLTKLDGTAKGGVVLGICDELKLPVRYIGLGERAEDLREFHVESFVEALFGKGEGEAAAA